MNEIDQEELADKCRRHDADRFAVLCRMHLLFQLDMSYHEFDSNSVDITSSAGLLSKSSKLRRRLAARMQRPWQQTEVPRLNEATSNEAEFSLTKERMECLRQLMDFLSHETNLAQEGVFRKSGKKSRQQELYDIILEGKHLDMNVHCSYNAHDCASVLKRVLADLSEPLLTEAHYAIHCQIAGLSRDKEVSSSDRRVQSLQLLFLLLPLDNRQLLRWLLSLLHKVSRKSSLNRMNAANLATMVAPHILCPRKMVAEELCHKSSELNGAVAFMIEQAPLLFLLPPALIRDLHVFEDASDEAVRTTVTFCERRCPQSQSQSGSSAVESVNDTTAVALAQLYAHVQSMPDSLKKKQLIKQFNKENKKGTPVLNTASALLDSKTRRQRSKSLRKSLKTKLFGRHRRHATVSPLRLKTTFNGVSSQKEETRLKMDSVQVVTDQMETIRHPAYSRNSANMQALRATVSKGDIYRNQQSTNCNVMTKGPSSSPLTILRQHSSVFALINVPSITKSAPGSWTKLSGKSWAAYEHVIVYKETAL